jgi:hypothetical protein
MRFFTLSQENGQEEETQAIETFKPKAVVTKLKTPQASKGSAKTSRLPKAAAGGRANGHAHSEGWEEF